MENNYNNFENLLCWQKAKDLIIKIYNIFKGSKDY
jgi:hypothetical protein